MAETAPQTPQPCTGLQMIEQALGLKCASCGTDKHLHRGEAVAEVTDGVVRTETRYWCPIHRYATQQLEPDERDTPYWVLLDQITGLLVTDDEGTVERWTIEASAIRGAAIRRAIDARRFLG
ncbi:hypothetical protein ACFW1A_10625 [Kitasatospora sp. NPDC058965]|uniref:hypothetical protein n=1 Tax=Kitasatospora sp. NPDC058965 TaxID=3346682 RepID=UPI0036CD3039